MTNMFGALGGLLFLFSAIAVAWSCIKARSATGVPLVTAILVVAGAASFMAHMLICRIYDGWLFASYLSTFLCWMTAVVMPRKAKS